MLTQILIKKKIMNVKSQVASEFSFFLSSIVISKGSESDTQFFFLESLTPLHNLSSPLPFTQPFTIPPSCVEDVYVGWFE